MAQAFAAAHPELKRVHVAEEAVLPCRTEFKGKKFQNVRTARNKATKEGIRTRWTSWAELDLTTIAKITALSEEWVAEKALPEMGFTLGGLEEMKVPGTRLLLAEAQDGTLHGVIVQFGGQTPLKLAQALKDEGIPILGTTPDAIDLAEDRERFQKLLHELGLKQPPNRTARTEEAALQLAQEIGYPLVVRPSYVLGGRAMEIVHGDRSGRAHV